MTRRTPNPDTHRTWKPICPHCHGPALTRLDESLLVALYTAPPSPRLNDVADIVGSPVRSLRRSVRTWPELFTLRSRVGYHTTIALTPAGLRAAESLAGVGERAAE